MRIERGDSNTGEEGEGSALIDSGGSKLPKTVQPLSRNAEDCWVNLYGFYRLWAEGDTGPHYADVIPIASALVEARPDRVFWGSNWPHAIVNATPDDGDLVNFIPAAIPDPHHQKLVLVLVDNPAKLYGGKD